MKNSLGNDNIYLCDLQLKEKKINTNTIKKYVYVLSLWYIIVVT